MAKKHISLDEEEKTPEESHDEHVELTEHKPEESEKLEEKKQESEVVVSTETLTIKNLFNKYIHGYWRHRAISLPISAILLASLLLFIPAVRYPVLGLFIKEDAYFSIIDSTTKLPVAGAMLEFGNQSSPTDTNGRTKLIMPLGHHTIKITKKYYKQTSTEALVTTAKNKNNFAVRITATGRLVPIAITDKISGKPILGAIVKVLDVTAKTDKSGKVIVALPVNKPTQEGSASADGYNQSKISVQVTKLDANNVYSLAPSGYIYFLSNQSGKIDVVKSLLDGSDRRIVLSGTGNEDIQKTVLLVTRDWKYLALWTQRKARGSEEIDLIDTTTDKMTNIDEGDTAKFTLYGWYDHRFVYKVDRSNLQDWDNARYALKSFDAESGKIKLLDQTSGSGSSWSDGDFEYYETVNIVDEKVVFVKSWSGGRGYDKGFSVYSISPDGSNKKTVKTFPEKSRYYYSATLINPKTLYLPVVSEDTAWPYKEIFWQYKDGEVTKVKGVSYDTFNPNEYPTYLQSPSEKYSFWSVFVDGKNNLNIGTEEGGNPTMIQSGSDYDIYGWYTDNYVLVKKNDSELFIMSASGGKATKISNYFKPKGYTFRGYGGGYGGL